MEANDIPQRKIIHIDMDAFYASIEQLDFPELRGKPVAVGSPSERGVISAASYEARKFGVKSAMSSVVAIKRCPHLIFTPHRFDRYKEISKIIRNIFFEYTNLVEPLSLDEAFLDVTQNKKNIQSATLIAKEIRQKIYETTGLTASAGISINKFVAKIASDENKPNGQKTIKPNQVQEYLDQLNIERFFGIGKKTSEKMFQLGIFKGKDLREKSLEFLMKHFGNSGINYYKLARGIHDTPVISNRKPKSVGAEQTFEKNLSSEIFIEEKLKGIALDVNKRLVKQKTSGKTITLKIKYSDFTIQTRSFSFPYYIQETSLIFDTAKQLLYKQKLNNSVRLIGIQVSNLNINKKKQTYIQLKLDL